MKKLLGTVAIVATVPAMASAVGLDRSAQDVGILFEEGNYAELSFGRVFPSADGEDAAIFGGQDTGSVLENYSQVGLGVKYELNDQLSFAVIFDQPYGVNTKYPEGVPGVDGSLALGGTKATVDSRAISALARYKFNENYSVHGGLRYQELQADVELRGLAYGSPGFGVTSADPSLNGYRGQFESDGDVGVVIGAAYEMPEIALRVALTYFSGTTHKLPTTETINGVPVGLISPAFSTNSVTEVEAPEAINLDFQTGIAADTLLFGTIRYARYEDTKVSPGFFDALSEPTVSGSSLTDIDSSYSLALGVGRRFNDKLSGSLAFGYEPSRDELVSPLAPTDGSRSISVGLAYDVTEQFTVSGGLRYVRLGDAKPATAGAARADFEDNDVVAVGVNLGYSF